MITVCVSISRDKLIELLATQMPDLGERIHSAIELGHIDGLTSATVETFLNDTSFDYVDGHRILSEFVVRTVESTSQCDDDIPF